MPADISRDSFDARKGYASVLLQQGRLLTDADWNEQAAIMQHALRLLSRDLFGAHAVPPHAPTDSFRIDAVACSMERIHGRLLAGRYWVDGIPFEAQAPSVFALDDPGTGAVLVMLQASQQEIAPWQDPVLRDPVLQDGNGHLRTRWQWQLSLLPCDAAIDTNALPRLPARGRIRVRLRQDDDAPGGIPAASGYQGVDNTLYRVQILRGGDGQLAPTFAWARANGSQQQALREWIAQSDGRLHVELDAPDALDRARVGEWVRFVHVSAATSALALLQVLSSDGQRMILQPAEGTSAGDYPLDGPASLQRWHHAGSAAHGGGVAIAPDRWFALEHGIEIAFDADTPLPADDYWLIPARAGASLPGWPDDAPQPAHGPERVQAPLALLQRDAADAAVMSCIDLRWQVRLERTPAGTTHQR